MKCFKITQFAQENFVNGNVSFSQHILNQAKLHTQVLFCCLGCSLTTTLLSFYNYNAK